jgi:hypothetical protein
MRKIFPSLLFLLTLSLGAHAQCVIDPNNNVRGTSPGTIGTLCIGVQVDKAFQVAIPNDTTVTYLGFIVTAEFDSVLFTIDPASIPAGLSYNCTRGCMFLRTASGDLSRGCVNVTGKPTVAIDGQMKANAHVWVNALGTNQEYDYPTNIAIKVLENTDPLCKSNGLENFEIGESLSVFPNPSKGNGFVQLDLPNATFVTIDVYDVLGNKMGNLHNGNMNQGTNQVAMNSLNLLTNGMYMVKVEIDSQNGMRTYTERMIIR